MTGLGFEEWYLALHPRLVSSLTVVTGDVDSATDAVDEAFVRAFERWDRVATMVSPAGWTYRTALNASRRRARRAAFERTLHRHAPSVDAPQPPPDWSAEMWALLQQLPVRERTAIALRYIADLSTNEIATAMGVAPGTVGSTLTAARRNLERLLDLGNTAGDGGQTKERTGA